MMCAVVNMLLAALLGVALGANKTHGFLPVSQLDGVLAHAHLAGLGWGVMMVMGAGYRLLPMMLPSAVPSGAGPLASTALTQLGVWLLVAARIAAAPPAILTVASLAAAGGVALFLIQVVWMLRHPRPAPAAQPRPDLGVAHALQALVWLAVSTASGVWLALAPASDASLAVAMAYGVLALVGFLAQMVVGVAARLVPLYAWLWGFADRPPRAIEARTDGHARLVDRWSAFTGSRSRPGPARLDLDRCGNPFRGRTLGRSESNARRLAVVEDRPTGQLSNR
jgi:hypothetical protein